MTDLMLPTSVQGLDLGSWETYRPFFDELQSRDLTPNTTRRWLEDWSQLGRLLWEAISVVYIEKSMDTTIQEKEQTFLNVIRNVIPPADIAYHALKERLLALDVPDEDMVLVIRNLRNEAELFREANVPLQVRLNELDNAYDKITGGLKAVWQGKEENLNELRAHLGSSDREVRKQAWHLIMGQWSSVRTELNDIYREMLTLRRQIAANADFPDYRDYAFRSIPRFDYSPEDCLAFHNAIERTVVPAAQRLLERKRRQAGYDRLRPWDRVAELGHVFQVGDLPQLHPYQGQDELVAGAVGVLGNVDPALGAFMQTMADEKLLDLDTRPGKALGGSCSTFPVRRRPFIFMNGVGTHDDVQTLLHEAGHAFHVFESAHLPLVWHLEVPLEFAEVASMAMELLAAPNLAREQGGFYSADDAARARLEHLEGIILFWPYMAIVDAFQHWVYTHPDEAMDSNACDRQWHSLSDRFEPFIDWEGYEEIRATGWHRKTHIFGTPFYYIEYAMARVGALQIWRNSMSDRPGAVAAYRRALSLGGTRTLPELFEVAGAEFRFDADMLGELVSLLEAEIEALESQVGMAG